MFPFGSFLTQIPLILIGALYMLYLGLYAVNKSKERTGIGESGVKEQFISGYSVDDPDIFYLVDSFSKEKDDAIEGKSSWIGFYASYIDKTDIIPGPDIYSHFFAYHLFPRPPPVI